ncbi:MAG TPA: type I glyceraldehyde-3-phosphate dehydrogenase [Candidatus Margulisbacteria bacterium]|nr:MAG: type I glyceraldehyde-3-phosphate dehydrogenase [Candidatus Margulisbacteria bacterium GWD2_39_127]OGI05286.1 MAG: type I glyceraldehyde-3-phosphate dehydrogenase [Candidatus Margulisbacteria bacterium GWF2_38_17]HAR64280.1 type I glyceraldehyde-3-phosphate dehydrogenase [Candidatus Margulisiibacteriota bacterium]HCT85345.1 type I glyceraldehyde-3-phosphate dehydrogenase [Candidatus Margulisiibacteriota bacterium]
MARVAINGLGRIGRAALKVILETPELELVAVNDLGKIDSLVYLLKYDSVYGRYEKKIEADDDLLIEDKRYKFLSVKDPGGLPWKELHIDIVFECTGVFTKKEDLQKHLNAGARTVILSTPSKSEDVGTVIYGVNSPEGNVNLVSCASCTTNSIAPVIEIIGRRIGLKKAIMTTFHAYTATQSIVDSPNKKLRRGRAAAINFVPSSTGAAIATTRALPQYKGKFDGIAIRGPVPAGSISDVVLITERTTSIEEINNIFKEEAATEKYIGVMRVTEDEVVSSDIIKDPHAAIIDLTLTKVVDGDLVKIMSWYDNEWGYTNQMVKEGVALAKTM